MINSGLKWARPPRKKEGKKGTKTGETIPGRHDKKIDIKGYPSQGLVFPFFG